MIKCICVHIHVFMRSFVISFLHLFLFSYCYCFLSFLFVVYDKNCTWSQLDITFKMSLGDVKSLSSSMIALVFLIRFGEHNSKVNLFFMHRLVYFTSVIDIVLRLPFTSEKVAFHRKEGYYIFYLPDNSHTDEWWSCIFDDLSQWVGWAIFSVLVWNCMYKIKFDLETFLYSMTAPAICCRNLETQEIEKLWAAKVYLYGKVGTWPCVM